MRETEKHARMRRVPGLPAVKPAACGVPPAVQAVRGAIAAAALACSGSVVALPAASGLANPPDADVAERSLVVEVIHIEWRLDGAGGARVLVAQQTVRPAFGPRPSGSPESAARAEEAREARRAWLRRPREAQGAEAGGDGRVEPPGEMRGPGNYAQEQQRMHMSRDERRALRAAIRDAGYQLYVPSRAQAEPPQLQYPPVPHPSVELPPGRSPR